jgi:pimeloyl-ACP methyl ester carboxylesterase
LKRKILVLLTSLLIVAMLASIMLPMTKATPLTITDKDSYMQYVGTLGGANFVVRIPDDWNGMLIVGCHGYAYNPPYNPDYQFAMDVGSNNLVSKGFAFAASSFGEAGYTVWEGMQHTHQLTEWVIDNFHVTGKVFLFGLSMGGTISLLLGEKYPELYSGVLDVCGGKDLTARYYYIQDVLSRPTLTQSQRVYFTKWGADIVEACGGTPEDRQQFYDRLSPTCHANIAIPVISIHGTADTLLPYTQAQEYGVAVADAGCSAFYKAYTVVGGGHCTPDVMAVAFSHVNDLVSYPNGW